MSEIAKEDLTDARKQLHWASQLLSSAADAKLESVADDSHSNLGWNPDDKALENRLGISLEVPRLTIVTGPDRFELVGKTLGESANWLGKKLDRTIVFRDYEMPEHGVANGQVFSAATDHLNEIANWFSFAQKVLVPFGDLRVWPHHFDLGFWQPGQIAGRSIGGGFSLGDNHFSQPYFYVNPYGIDRPASLPTLVAGNWVKDWLGAVITADEMSAVQGTMEATSSGFVRSAVEQCLELIR